jgi:hypothetical protein
MAKKAAKAKKKSVASATRKKPSRGTIEIFDPFGPGFRVFHKDGAKRTHIGGAQPAAGRQSGARLTLRIFDPFGKGFRVVKKGGN